MNDRYLYRAKRKDNGEWVEGYLVYDNFDHEYRIVIELDYSTGTCIHATMAPRVDQSTKCQCTGVYDKNKKTIFEKDIVNDEDGSTGIVEYGMYAHYHIGFFVRWLNKEADYYRNELGYWADKVECIGSAIDNPELLDQ